MQMIRELADPPAYDPRWGPRLGNLLFALCPYRNVYSPNVYRQMRKVNPKLWLSDGALGNYAEWAHRWIGNEKRPLRIPMRSVLYDLWGQ
jgi:hypothetical protein